MPYLSTIGDESVSERHSNNPELLSQAIQYSMWDEIPYPSLSWIGAAQNILPNSLLLRGVSNAMLRSANTSHELRMQIEPNEDRYDNKLQRE